MNLDEIAQALKLTTVVPPAQTGRPVISGYASDLLSCVLARATAGTLWITIQTHPNVIAVASMLDLAGVIIAEGAPIEEATIQKARGAGVALYSSPYTTFRVVKELAQIGIPGVDP